MGERALGWGLRLLGIALIIGPFIVALGTHNWDPKAAMLPSEEEISGLTDMLEGLRGEEFFFKYTELVDKRIVGDNLEITVRFTSTIGFDLEIDEFSSKLTCALETPHAYLANGNLKAPVTIESYSSGELILTADIRQAVAHYLAFHAGETPTINFENLSFQIYGITIETAMSLKNLSIPLW